MKVAFVGKGGSGKTTLSSLFIRHLARSGTPVMAVDADINQHLGVALGLSEREAAAIPAMGERLPEIKTYLRGTNPRITSPESMVKTTPPGEGSRLLRLGGADPIHSGLAVAAGGAKLMVTGPFTDEDLGVACYHSKTGAVELYLNHLVDGPGEYVVVDCTAGAESFASGMFTRFDLTFLVAEPTRKGVAVYRQWTDYAADYDVALKVIGNKVHGPERRSVPTRTRRRRLAVLPGPVRRRTRHGAGPPIRPRRPGPPGPRRTRGHPQRGGRPRQGLAEVHPPGNRVPHKKRPSLGKRRPGPRPGIPNRPRFRPGGDACGCLDLVRVKLGSGLASLWGRRPWPPRLRRDARWVFDLPRGDRAMREEQDLPDTRQSVRRDFGLLVRCRASGSPHCRGESAKTRPTPPLLCAPA